VKFIAEALSLPLANPFSLYSEVTAESVLKGMFLTPYTTWEKSKGKRIFMALITSSIRIQRGRALRGICAGSSGLGEHVTRR